MTPISVEIIHRKPTVEEFAAVTAAVGFKPHPDEAIAIGLANSFHCVCALADEGVVGLGRIVGDGGIEFCLCNIMVVPAFQRLGIGTRIVSALLDRMRQVTYENVLVEALPLPGLESFYARFGFKACRQYAPGMHLWLNPPPEKPCES
jgi:GNAT superfamily N-acetyltransferase